MATNVSLVVLTDTSSKFVLATVPAAPGFWQTVWGQPLADRCAAPMESWDFDRDTGTLVVNSVTDLGAQPQSLQVPLAALTRLRFAGVQETTGSDGYCDYQLQLFHDDGSQLGSMFTLPSSTHFLLKRPNEVRSAQSRLRAFLKPACPKLEGTFFEELGRWFTMGHQQRVQLMRERLGKLQAALEAISQHPHTPGMDVPRWREKLQGYQDKLGQACDSQAPNQAPSGEKRAGQSGWLVPAIGAFLGGVILFLWLSQGK
jgi:hypothetical protein